MFLLFILPDVYRTLAEPILLQLMPNPDSFEASSEELLSRIASEIQSKLNDSQRRWLATQSEALNTSNEQVMNDVFAEWLTRHPKVVALGEAGLDYFYEHGSREAQERGFRAHIAAARATGLPLVIHTREADEACGRILEDEMANGPFRAVLHCYTGGRDLAMKAITRRKRPNDVVASGSFNDTFFSGGKSPFKGSSFPSGHAAGVFSVATVVASRYHNHRWVPWVSYGFAAAISCSRITTLAHFPSDVFLGAALGYTITRYGTLAPR